MIWFSQFLTVNQTDFPATHRFVNEDVSSAVFPRKIPTCIFWLILVYFLFFGWFCFCFCLAKTKKNLCELKSFAYMLMFITVMDFFILHQSCAIASLF